MEELRERGIYLLPDGLRYYAERSEVGGYLLYPVRQGPAPEARYRVSGEGAVLDSVTLRLIFPAGKLMDTGGTYVRRR